MDGRNTHATTRNANLTCNTQERRDSFHAFFNTRPLQSAPAGTMCAASHKASVA
jgi:hypothetical protein